MGVVDAGTQAWLAMNLTPPLARQIIEVLGSSGTPPAKGVGYFNVGNGSLLQALDEYYLSSYLQDGGAAYKMVVGDYGSGKSHSCTACETSPGSAASPSSRWI
jgi:hypothetical protein